MAFNLLESQVTPPQEGEHGSFDGVAYEDQPVWDIQLEPPVEL